MIHRLRVVKYDPVSGVDFINDVAGISSMPNVYGSRYSNNAVAMGEALKDYVNSETGSIEWQWDHVRRTLKKSTKI